MKSKRLHTRLFSTTNQQLLTLPIVTLILIASISGCTTPPGAEHFVDRHSPTLDRHSEKSKEIDEGRQQEAIADNHFVPYAAPVIRANPGVSATAANKVRRCPSGTLRYCDHRRNWCACVVADDAYRALDISRTGF